LLVHDQSMASLWDDLLRDTPLISLLKEERPFIKAFQGGHPCLICVLQTTFGKAFISLRDMYLLLFENSSTIGQLY
jgi:hypothetical protein